ncbi:MAG: nucleoside monophosphate kinase [Planctomycetes bacterium]|nr:nucleoside monophosphate kinase [Planctomycetota bacterium]
MPTARPEAILLIGPTGSGKTPLGRLLQRRGLRGRRCWHFDFGQQLRDIAAAETPPKYLTPEDVQVIRTVLADGALLADEHFPIAERILRAFLDRCNPGPDELVVLNGLPRHVGQARDIERIMAVREVIYLCCTAEIVRRRIASDIGGDREGRCDDEMRSVRNRLKTFALRILPLTDHYRRAGVPVRTVHVGPETTAEQMWTDLHDEC